jgi:hypothetical protein
MSKKIRRVRFKSTHNNLLNQLLNQLPEHLRGLGKNFSVEQVKELLTVSDMTHFIKHHFDIDIHEEKLEAATSNSCRKVIVGGRRTGKTFYLVQDILYKAFTSTYKKIVVCGSHKYYIKEIFDRIRETIHSNHIIEQKVIREASIPFYELEFDNGSRIRGIDIKARGSLFEQNADHIYIDEFSRCNKRVFVNTILPILQVTPETTLTMVGSPPSDENWIPEDLELFDRYYWPGQADENQRIFYTPEGWSRGIRGIWNGYTRS